MTRVEEAVERGVELGGVEHAERSGVTVLGSFRFRGIGGAVPFERATFRSVCRLFWNQTVTERISL